VGDARVAAIDAPGTALRDGQRVAGTVHLLERPRPGPFGASAEVELAAGRHAGLRLLTRFPRELAPARPARVGMVLTIEGTFRRVAAPTGGEFDLASHLRRRGVAGELAVSAARSADGRRGGLAGALDRGRDRAEAGLAAGLAPVAAALAHGLVLGLDDRVPAAVRADFRDSGLAHLLAASGTNVVLLTALATPLLVACGLGPRVRIPILIALIALYVPLAGAEAPIQRAGVMGAASLLALALARPASRWYALGLAACATLALNPRAVGEPGWQLSFAAVAGIVVAAPPVRRALRPLPGALADGVAMTVAATLATAPLLAHHFGSVSLAGLPANVAALPLVASVMWLGMVRAALGQLDAVGGPVGVAAAELNRPLGALLGPLVTALERLAALFADAPAATLGVSLGSPWAVTSAYAAVIVAGAVAARAARRTGTHATSAVAYLRRLPRRRRVALALVSALLAAAVAARGLGTPGPPATLTISFLDVGQGDATLVQHPDGSAVLFDGGPPEGGVARLLRRAGVRRLSALVLTHASRDHHGGLAEVVERLPVEVLVDGGDGTADRSFRAVVARARARGARHVRATAPLTLRAGSLHVTVLSPPPRPPGPPPADPNPRAVAAVVASDGYELFLAGDAESEALLGLPLPDVDALKVSHHGSADAGLGELLARLRPELAAIPVGANAYGHPARSTVRTLRAAGVPTWRTDRHGTVRVSVDAGRVVVTAERGEAVEHAP
jgi:competence protein ComEC